MPYKLTIELSDRDLIHFRRELHKAREAVGIAEDEEILDACRRVETHDSSLKNDAMNENR